MAEVSVDYINPFLESAINIINRTTGKTLTIGKPYIRKTEFQKTNIMIIIGVTGQMKGQVILSLPIENACSIASAMMMGMPVPELDDMSLSAISELGNMIMGNASVILSNNGVGIDITPPTLARGEVCFDQLYTQNICVPLLEDGNSLLEVNVSVKMK